ncbi:MAG: hypothetical protein IJY09_03445 [Lachnospiraceae bacterium]|nr:hypothetical protein [Lachnospiraceae bacterium]
MRKNIRKAAFLGFGCAMLLCACDQKNEENVNGDLEPSVTAEPNGSEEVSVTPKPTEVPKTIVSAAAEELAIDAVHFPDEAFRTYLTTYVDLDKNGLLSPKERDALQGLGSVESVGGLMDGQYDGKENLKRAEMLRAVISLEGIEYFENLSEVHFEGAYQLKTLPLNNPKLSYAWVRLNSLEEFSLKNAEELNAFYYSGCENESIAWNEMGKLIHLELRDAEVASKDVLQCKELTYLSFAGCTVQAPEMLDFAKLSGLTEFYYSGAQPMAEEVDFGKNEKLKTVVFDAAVADKVVLRNKEINCQVKGNWEACEILFADELALDMTAELSDGSVWLSAENFPDVAFRQYLYCYIDADKDNILTTSERNTVYEMGDVEYQGKKQLEREQRKALLKKVRSFEGIQYLENLQHLILGEGYTVQRLMLNNTELQELNISERIALQELSIQNAEQLKYFCGSAAETTAIDWSQMKQLQRLDFSATKPMLVDLSELKELQSLSLSNVKVDFAKLSQNENLAYLTLSDCEAEKPLELLDFSEMEQLVRVQLLAKETPESYWVPSMKFGDGFQNSDDWMSYIEISSGITGTVTVGNKGVSIKIKGDETACKLIYEDELPEHMTAELSEEDIWNSEENIADDGLRRYMYYRYDVNKDDILQKEERERFTDLFDDGYDYAGIAENEHEWKVEDDISWDVREITTLKGLEYFPELVRIQLETMELSSDVKEIVITNPKLEIFDLRFNGNVELIDLTACKSLRICVVDTTRDADFVQEVSPTILLPEHLEFHTVEGMDCVIGEPALERFGK